MALKVFICYRREDTRPTAGRIHDSLKSELKSNVEIFRDVKNIPYGENFITVVEKALAECDVFLPLIGSRWLGLTDEHGQRRIDAEEDTVHIEIQRQFAVPSQLFQFWSTAPICLRRKVSVTRGSPCAALTCAECSGLRGQGD
jgi:hypothetical protein